MRISGAVLAGVVLLGLSGCATSVDGYHGIAVVERENNNVFLRGISCSADEPITALRLTGVGSEPLVWEIRPDDDAVVRIGTVDEVRELLGDEEWTIGLDGVTDTVLTVTFDVGDVESLGVFEHMVPDIPGSDSDVVSIQEAAAEVCSD